MERIDISPFPIIYQLAFLHLTVFYLFFVLSYFPVDEDLIKYGWPEDIW